MDISLKGLVDLLTYMVAQWGMPFTLMVLGGVLVAIGMNRVLQTVKYDAQTRRTEARMVQQLIVQVEALQREKDVLQGQVADLLLAEARRETNTVQTTRQMQSMQDELNALKAEIARVKLLWQDAERRYRAETVAHEAMVRENEEQARVIEALQMTLMDLENTVQSLQAQLAACQGAVDSH